MRWLPRRGLRSTVMLTFAFGALVLSIALAAGTYLAVRHALVEQRERTAQRQAFSAAAFVRDGLLTSGADVSEVLGAVSPPAGTAALVHRSGEWYSSSLEISSKQVPATVLDEAAAGNAIFAWARSGDSAATIVAVPLPSVDVVYIEVSSVAELERTLSTVRTTLIAFAVLTTIAGAVIGRVVSKGMLTPLDQVARAAGRISSGQLGTRLEPTKDPDLASLVNAFNDMVDALDRRIESDARFAADVSHELKTPLTALITSVSVLQRMDDLPPRATESVELISTELDRFRRSLEDLLLLGQLDADVWDSQRSTTDLRSLVEHALVDSGRSLALLDARVGTADPLPVLVDRRQLARVLTNLFDNADAHGDGLVSIRVESVRDHGEVHVVDAGPGVPVEDRERIFQRFVRLGTRGSRGGTGLGLNIVRETLRHHGGTVECRAADGGGADFVMRLPLVSEDGDPR